MRSKEWTWILPLAFLMGAGLSLAQPGDWWRGLVSFGLLSALGLWGLRRTWGWSGGGRTLAWAMALALALRLLAGIAWTVLLPVYGYDTPQQNAGYVFYDAYRRDEQSWDLARSGDPLLSAFDQSYSADQYGGLLAFTALLYRVFSPDAHRSLLPVLLGAWAASVSIAFAWRAITTAFGESYAAPAVWLLAFYPESILMGSAQMREPFLIALIIILVWGFVEWSYLGKRTAWGWLASGLAGMLLLSPGVAAFSVLWLMGWFWFRGTHSASAWRVLTVAGGVALIALALFSFGASQDASLAGFRLASLWDWFVEAARWDMVLGTSGSGWVQKLMSEMPEWLEMPFVLGYGLAQPVLPAAFVEPSLPIWQSLGILRALGWYGLLPFLAFGTLSLVWRRESQKSVWVWGAVIVWVWIIAAALRAGGDQWDNPRYRVIFLFVQALLLAYAWRGRSNPWFGRVLLLEAIFVLFFSQWYISRYLSIMGQIPFFAMVALIVLLWGVVIIGGVVWDIRKARRSA